MLDNNPNLKVVRRHEPDIVAAYQRSCLGETLLSPHEERALLLRVKKGDESAREQMIKANLRLVYKIASDYCSINDPNFLDIVSAGNIGLMTAVDRADPKYDNKLATYASWWIHQGIRRELTNHSKTVRLPAHVNEKLRKIRKVEERLHNEFGQPPSDEEIALEVGVTAEYIQTLRSYERKVVHLDAPISEDGKNSKSIYEVVPDSSATDALVSLSRAEQIEFMLDKLGEVLDEREDFIIRGRFLGIKEHHKGEPMTLEQVGEILEVTRERVRQVQNIALKKLRRAMEVLNRKIDLEVEGVILEMRAEIEAKKEHSDSLPSVNGHKK